jgi:hypothetical protein
MPARAPQEARELVQAQAQAQELGLGTPARAWEPGPDTPARAWEPGLGLGTPVRAWEPDSSAQVLDSRTPEARPSLAARASGRAGPDLSAQGLRPG